jgi:saccharopine dehydrogenase-like NADP-dependent oxidoreductase
VIVRAIANTLGGADVIERSLLLSASATAGPASFDYFLQELTMPFQVHVDGADRPARAFSDPRPIEFPAPFGLRPAYLFPFSDQVLYPLTMGAGTAVTRLAIEPTRLARLLSASVRVGAARLVAGEGMRRALASRRRNRAPSEIEGFALRVDVTHDGRSANATLVGRAQADAAAAGASATVRCLMEGAISDPGVWMPEQVINPPRFFADLALHGLTVRQPRD